MFKSNGYVDHLFVHIYDYMTAILKMRIILFLMLIFECFLSMVIKKTKITWRRNMIIITISLSTENL